MGVKEQLPKASRRYATVCNALVQAGDGALLAPVEQARPRGRADEAPDAGLGRLMGKKKWHDPHPEQRGYLKRSWQATLRAEFERRGPTSMYECAEALDADPALVRGLLEEEARAGDLPRAVAKHLGIEGPWMTLDLDYCELDDLWPKLNKRDRAALVALARSLAGHSP